VRRVFADRFATQPLLDGIEPWSRQSGESKQAFEAWLIYRDLGFRGTYTKVGEQLGKSVGLIERWALPSMAWKRRSCLRSESVAGSI
jgi:hypothetical protein